MKKAYTLTELLIAMALVSALSGFIFKTGKEAVNKALSMQHSTLYQLAQSEAYKFIENGELIEENEVYFIQNDEYKVTVNECQGNNDNGFYVEVTYANVNYTNSENCNENEKVEVAVFDACNKKLETSIKTVCKA